MAALVFRKWPLPNQLSRTKKDQDTKFYMDLSKLGLLSSVAMANALPDLDASDRATLQGQFGDSRWCSLDLLREAADKVLMAWLEHNFSETEMCCQDRLKLVQLQHIEDSDTRRGLLTTDGTHKLNVVEPYSIEIACKNWPTQTHQGCAHAGRKTCPLRSISARLFEFPRTPTHILERLHNPALTEVLRSYQHYRKPTSFTVSEDWSAKREFAPMVRAAFIGAVRRKTPLLQRLVLNEPTHTENPLKQHAATTYNGWKVSCQELLSWLACNHQWSGFMALCRDFNTIGRPSLTPKHKRYHTTPKISLLDHHVKALALTLATDIAQSKDDTLAFAMMAWWV